MSNLRISTAARNVAADAIVDLIDVGSAAGVLRIYTGTQPSGPGAAATGTLLATVTLGDPAFGASSGGTATGADPAAVVGVADGDAGWFRISDSNGLAIIDGDVSATGGGGDLQLSTTTISDGLSIDITSLSITMPAS